MQRDKTVLEVFCWLQENETKRLCEGLNAWIKLCSCDVNGKKEKCALLKCIELSPKCIELFQVWATFNTSLGTNLLEVEYIPCLLTSERHEETKDTPLKKCDTLERAALCHLLVTCFALVLEHTELDTACYLTHQSRVVISSCLLKYCIRPLYRLMKFIDLANGNFTGVCQLLKSFTMINTNITEIFLNSFNFNHPLFVKLLVYPNTSYKQPHVFLRQHSLYLQNGFLDIVHLNETRRKCREELVQLFLNLLHSPYIMELLEKKKFFSYIIKYLYFDSINECYKILKCLKSQICDSIILSHRTKMDVFSYNILENLCFTWTLYGIVYEMQKQLSQEIFFVSQNDKETLMKTLKVFKELLKWRMCQGFFETEKEVKIIKECSSWLQNIFFKDQQELFCQVLCESPVYCIDILDKLERNFLTQKLAFSLPNQPCLCGVWIHYTILVVRLLHPCMDVLFNSFDILLQDEMLNLYDGIHEISSKKKSQKEKLIFQIQKHLLPFNENKWNSEKKWSLSLVQEPCFWLPAIRETQEECTKLSQGVSLICGGVSHFFNSSNLTSMILNPSPSMVFIGLSVLQSFICRALRLKKRYESCSKLHSFLDRFMMIRLVDLQTLIHLISKFMSDTPSLPYDWCLAYNIGEEKIQYDYREEEIKQDLEIDDLQLPTVQTTPTHAVLNSLTSKRLSLSSCQFSLKHLLQEFHSFLPMLANEETDLFSRWCFTLEIFFRCLSCDKNVTNFNWCQLLNLPFNSYERNLSKKQEWKCIERQLAVLKLLDAIWNLNTFDYEEKKYHLLQEQTTMFLGNVLKWFQSVFRLWQYLLQGDNTAYISWIVSLEKCIENFLYQTGIFTNKTFKEEIHAWIEFLKPSCDKNHYKKIFCDFFLKQIENVLIYFTEFFQFVCPKFVFEKKKKNLRISFFTISSCSLWYENLNSFLPFNCITELCCVLKKHITYEISTAMILLNTLCDFLLTLAKKGNLKKQRMILWITSHMRYVNFLKEEITLNQVEERIEILQDQIKNIKPYILKRPKNKNILLSDLKKCPFPLKQQEVKYDWIENFKMLIETIQTSYSLQQEWYIVQEECKKYMREEKTSQNITVFLFHFERCLQAMSISTHYVSLFQNFQNNHVFNEWEEFLIKILNDPNMKNILNISLKCIIHYVFIMTTVKMNEIKEMGQKKKWSRRPRYDSLKEFLKKIRFTYCVKACCEEYFQLTKIIFKDDSLQLYLLKFLVLYSFAFKEEWLCHWPEEWINSLIISSYQASLSEKDQIIAWLKQQVQKIKNSSSTIWFEKYHGFHDVMQKQNNEEFVDIQQNLFTWFQPNATRLIITLNNFPYHQNSSLTLTSFQDIFIYLFDTCENSLNKPLQENNLYDSFMFPKKEFIYDPAYLFPFLLEKFQIAWYALHPIQQPETPSFSPSTYLQHTINKSNKSILIECFTHLVDKEGIWLRRIASEGILQLLILGLACTDSQIRYTVSQTLALYRHFLLESLQETIRREQVHYHKSLWRKAVALCKENHLNELQKKSNKETIYKIYLQLKQENKEPQRYYYTFKEIREILTLLDLLKNTIILKQDGSLTSLSTTLAAFSASCVPILLDCSHSLYLFVNKFLVSRASLNSTSLPLFHTNYWSVRPKSCHAEAYFVFLVIARCFGLKNITQNTVFYDEMIEDCWILFNQQGVLPLLLTKVPYFNSELMLQNITYREFTLHAWNVMMKILFSFSNNLKRVQWLLSHYGILQWMESHLYPFVLCLKHDEKLCFIRHSSYQEIQMFSQLVKHYFMTSILLLEKFKSVLLSSQKQLTIYEEEKKYSFAAFHEKIIDSLLQLIQSLEVQTNSQLGSSFQLACC